MHSHERLLVVTCCFCQVCADVHIVVPVLPLSGVYYLYSQLNRTFHHESTAEAEQ